MPTFRLPSAQDAVVGIVMSGPIKPALDWFRVFLRVLRALVHLWRFDMPNYDTVQRLRHKTQERIILTCRLGAFPGELRFDPVEQRPEGGVLDPVND